MVKLLLGTIILWLTVCAIVGYTARVALGNPHSVCPEDAAWIFGKCTPMDDFGVCKVAQQYARVHGTYGAMHRVCTWQRNHLTLWK